MTRVAATAAGGGAVKISKELEPDDRPGGDFTRASNSEFPGEPWEP